MAKDWTKLFKKYKGQWVALSESKESVLGSGKTVKEAVMNAKKVSHETPFLTRIPETLDSYVGSL